MLKVLIVDDCNARVEMIARAVKDSDIGRYIDLDCCGTADRARSAMLQPFDVLILDILIPKKDGGVAQALHSINLLSDITDPGKKFIRPRLIIGLTADTVGLKSHQESFLKVAAIVVDGNLIKLDWLNLIVEQLRDATIAAQKTSKLVSDKILISVHGIRTFGHWQKELKQGLEKYSRSFQHIEVKYGFFDLLSFVIPALRQRKAKAVARRIAKIITENPSVDIHIVAHSFGTLVVSEALKLRLEKKVKNIIFCGSPMLHSTDIDHIISNSERTINDCGTRDYVLIAARMFVFGLGDAGRVGFMREHSPCFNNRYHRGGHDLYFRKIDDETSFIEEFWLPALISEKAVSTFDCRKNYFGEDILDLGIKLVSAIKPVAYWLLPPVAIFIIVRALT